ncbi:type III secretion protein [Pseudomonas sp. UBA1879]|uniref:type III secretion protein n=1 Tax=Pseudomonas sp. UBA1879 TaxID=1947305 RepID=UPI0025E25772|nr:type III secretion protein [Pseudomonas sp. UBA1879]
MQPAMLDADQRWIQWWCAPWQWAHGDWLTRFAEDSRLPLSALSGVLRTRHGLFLHSVGIAPSQPPVPAASVLHWLALDAVQQQYALNLAASICLGRVIDESPHERWCRAVAKALRPGAWLDARVQDPRELLAAWVGQDCWSRLRLSWSPDAVPDAVIEMPVGKLHTLWQSVLWRASTP